VTRGVRSSLRAVTVFCGSSPGARPEYAAAAATLGQLLAARGIRLVYGGGRVGTMGALADGALAAGGRVTGVIPRGLLEREVGHTGLDDLRVVDSMHERKALMAELGDAFVALPGGLGTLEEFFEIWSWGLLGLHAKPLGLLNLLGYYDPLITFLDHATREGFIQPQHRAMAVVEVDAGALLERLAEWEGAGAAGGAEGTGDVGRHAARGGS
jgi:hypothetical protein